jgi:hypothetical protein
MGENAADTPASSPAPSTRVTSSFGPVAVADGWAATEDVRHRLNKCRWTSSFGP